MKTFAQAAPARRRLWSLEGFPNAGKSTFATALRTPLLPIDADGRFINVVTAQLAPLVYRLSDDEDFYRHMNDVKKIRDLLVSQTRGIAIGTIIIDSLTAILQPYIMAGMEARDDPNVKNKSAPWNAKARAVRTLQDAVTAIGADVLWIWHLQDTKFDGKELVRPTVTQLEQIRLQRSLNAQLKAITDEKKGRGIYVKWARGGRSGMTLWDDKGFWQGMPERIETACWGDFPDRALTVTTDLFASEIDAIQWAVDQGGYDTLEESAAAWNSFNEKNTGQGPINELYNAWKLQVSTLCALGKDRREEMRLQAARSFSIELVAQRPDLFPDVAAVRAQGAKLNLRYTIAQHADLFAAFIEAAEEEQHHV